MLTTLGFRYPLGRETRGECRHPSITRRLAGRRPHRGRQGPPAVRRSQLIRFGQAGWQTASYPAGIGHSLTPMAGRAGRERPGA